LGEVLRLTASWAPCKRSKLQAARLCEGKPANGGAAQSPRNWLGGQLESGLALYRQRLDTADAKHDEHDEHVAARSWHTAALAGEMDAAGVEGCTVAGHPPPVKMLDHYTNYTSATRRIQSPRASHVKPLAAQPFQLPSTRLTSPSLSLCGSCCTRLTPAAR
jgi:hypothetical protein